MKLRENFPLLFSWEPKKWLPGWLWLFLPLSALAHAASFFLFRVVYPNHPSLPVTPPRVLLLNNSLPEHSPLLQWIDTHNPALMAPPPTDSAQLPLAEPSYRPSFESLHTEPAMPPKESPSSAPPPIFSPLTILRARKANPAPPSASHRPTPTTVRLSPELQRRNPTVPATLASLTPARPMPGPKFLLGVTDSGAVRFIFLQASSGNDALDDAAADSLLRLTFQPEPAPVSWGFARVDWGDSVAQGPRPETGLQPSATPPSAAQEPSPR